jgi:gamma-glutamyltranspeptidase
MKRHSRRLPWAFLLVFLFTILAVFATTAQTASFRPEKSTDGAVVATSKYATEAGMRVLREGGNAVDAAVAVGHTMAVTHPVEPYKRPLSSMSPTIVLKDHQVYMVLGSPGGARIITTVMQVMLNVIDHGMTIREAVDAPRVHLQWIPDELRIEKNGLSADTMEKLTAMGYKIQVKPNMGDVNAIMVDPKTKAFLKASDPRNNSKGIS